MDSFLIDIFRRVAKIRLTPAVLCFLWILPIIVGGCSSGEKGGTEDGKIQLRFSFWGTPEEAQITEDLIQAFEAENPDVEIIAEHVPATSADAYRMKILTGFAGSVAPDILFVERSQFKAFASKKAFTDLTPYIESEADFPLKDFNPIILDAFTHEGRCYAIPRDIGIMVVFYNVNIFEEAGLPFPPNTWEDDKWTWEAFRKTAIALTKDFEKDGRTDQWGLVMDTWTDQWAPYIYQNKGDILLNKHCVLDSPQNIETFQFLSDLIHKDKVMPSPEDLVSGMGRNSLDLFRSGKAAMYPTGFWTNSSLILRGADFRWDVGAYPMKEAKATCWHGSALAICSQSKNPSVAWRFLKFTTKKEVQLRLASSGLLIPSRQSVSVSKEFLEIPGLPKNMPVFIEGLKYARSPYIQEVPELDYMVRPEQGLSAVWNGRKPVAEVLHELTAKINEVIDQKKVELY